MGNVSILVSKACDVSPTYLCRTLAVAGLPAAVYEVPQSATDPIDDIACSEVSVACKRGWLTDTAILSSCGVSDVGCLPFFKAVLLQSCLCGAYVILRWHHFPNCLSDYQSFYSAAPPTSLQILGSVMAWCRNQSQLQSLLLKEASGVSETTQEVASPPVEKPQPQPQLSSSEGQPTTSSELQFILMGHSRGGKISTLQAASRPESVAGLVLVDPVDASFEAGSGSKVDPRWDLMRP